MTLKQAPIDIFSLISSKQKLDINQKPLSTYEYMIYALFHNYVLIICILFDLLWVLGSSLGLSSKKLKRVKRAPPNNSRKLQ